VCAELQQQLLVQGRHSVQAASTQSETVHTPLVGGNMPHTTLLLLLAPDMHCLALQ
jgi:hypothetical protein